MSPAGPDLGRHDCRDPDKGELESGRKEKCSSNVEMCQSFRVHADFQTVIMKSSEHRVEPWRGRIHVIEPDRIVQRPLRTVVWKCRVFILRVVGKTTKSEGDSVTHPSPNHSDPFAFS